MKEISPGVNFASRSISKHCEGVRKDVRTKRATVRKGVLNNVDERTGYRTAFQRRKNVTGRKNVTTESRKASNPLCGKQIQDARREIYVSPDEPRNASIHDDPGSTANDQSSHRVQKNPSPPNDKQQEKRGIRRSGTTRVAQKKSLTGRSVVKRSSRGRIAAARGRTGIARKEK